MNSIEQVVNALHNVNYEIDKKLATVLYLSIQLKRPLLLEGEPGVGKTELAKALALILQRPLVRLQCYEGLELRDALYEWNYTAQLLHLRSFMLLNEHNPEKSHQLPEVYLDKFLLSRPLLYALQCPPPGCVLLIDEIDRTDEPFEAFLLEYLGEYQVTIPEMGSIKARTQPITILTSNRTRELNSAIKRRCLYHWVDYPDKERELRIIQQKLPNLQPEFTHQIVEFISKLRAQTHSFQQVPGISEAIEWAEALVALDALHLDPSVVSNTAGILFKQKEDIANLNNEFLQNYFGHQNLQESNSPSTIV